MCIKSEKSFNTETLQLELESAYRRNKTDATKLAFRRQANVVSKLITTARRSYYRTLISLSSNQPKKLWASLDSLLSCKTSPFLPLLPLFFLPIPFSTSSRSEERRVGKE